MACLWYLCVLSRGGSLLFEHCSESDDPKVSFTLQFVAFAAQDILDQATADSNLLYYKEFDHFTHFSVTALVSVGGTRFFLVHPAKFNEDSVRQFLGEIHQNYVKVFLLQDPYRL